MPKSSKPPAYPLHKAWGSPDIDWYGFVHGPGSECRRQLWIDERGTSGDLAEVWIRCECGKAELFFTARRVPRLHHLKNTFPLAWSENRGPLQNQSLATSPYCSEVIMEEKR